LISRYQQPVTTIIDTNNLASQTLPIYATVTVHVTAYKMKHCFRAVIAMKTMPWNSQQENNNLLYHSIIS